jgi:hypothetical protein
MQQCIEEEEAGVGRVLDKTEIERSCFDTYDGSRRWRRGSGV